MYRIFIASALILVAGLVRANDLSDPGFESPGSTVWRGPIGGGLLGGAGGGEILAKADGGWPRTGRRAAALKIWGHTNENAVAWSSISQTIRCAPLARIRAQAWVCADTNGQAGSAADSITQLRVDFFADEAAKSPTPTRATFSESYPSAAKSTNLWTQLAVATRVPSDARSMTVSVVLMADKRGAQPRTIWVDDLSVESSGGHPR